MTEYEKGELCRLPECLGGHYVTYVRSEDWHWSVVKINDIHRHGRFELRLPTEVLQPCRTYLDVIPALVLQQIEEHQQQSSNAA